MDRLGISSIVRRMEPLSAMPEAFPAGTTLKLRRSHADYPADDGWGLTLYLAGAQTASAVGSPNGSAFDLTLSAATTAALSPGTYRWLERASKGGEIYDVAAGYVTVLRNLATAGPGDALSFAEATLADVEAGIQAIASGKLSSYQVAGRGGEYLSMEDLMKLRAQLINEINMIRSGGRVGRQHLVVFRKAGPA